MRERSDHPSALRQRLRRKLAQISHDVVEPDQMLRPGVYHELQLTRHYDPRIASSCSLLAYTFLTISARAVEELQRTRFIHPSLLEAARPRLFESRGKRCRGRFDGRPAADDIWSG